MKTGCAKKGLELSCRKHNSTQMTAKREAKAIPYQEAAR